VTGPGVFYFITMAGVLTVLALSANTSFADFPRLCRAIATTFVVIVAKFTEGAWITALAIPGLVWLMSAVHHHYERIEREAESNGPADLKDIPSPIVVLPLQRWNKVSEKALRFAYTFSRDLVVVHITPKGQD
jgi:hypothetical protein